MHMLSVLCPASAPSFMVGLPRTVEKFTSKVFRQMYNDFCTVCWTRVNINNYCVIQTSTCSLVFYYSGAGRMLSPPRGQLAGENMPAIDSLVVKTRVVVVSGC